MPFVNFPVPATLITVSLPIELVAIVGFVVPSVSPVKIEVSLYPETVICENAVVVSRAEAATKLSVVFFIVFLFVV
jgi:hypothetical protein